MRVSGWKCATAIWWCVAVSVVFGAAPAQGATIFVGAGGDLQAAINAAQPGDTILLQEGAEFVGAFLLPVKPAGDPITLRSSAPDSLLPLHGERVTPAHARLLARIRSGSSGSALRTAPGTRGWRLQYLEFAANDGGYGDLIQIGDGSYDQSTLASVPSQFVLQHLYVHGDPLVGQKRCIALNAANVTIRDSFIAECKTVGQDSQAIGGWNGTGPYVIENNYIEGAGENFLLGGAAPGIQNVIAEGIIFRRNHVSRPLSWRLPIIPTPYPVQAAASTGGSLAAGTYGYRVVARRVVGQGTMGRSTAAPEVTATVADGGTVTITWTAVPDATQYRVYGRTAGGQTMFWTVSGTTFVDDGRAGTAENVPTSRGTVWLVKNLFELKNARNVVVEDNVFENNWQQAQAGYAIVLTPRNSGNGCSWCLVEDVRFERNIVRNVAAAFNILGYDSPETSGQARRITLRNNLVYDVHRGLGGNGWFLIVGDEPRDVIIDHNTIEFEGTTLVNVYGGTSTAPRPIYGFVMTNNATMHGKYGMGGSYFAYGNDILNNYYPDAIFLANYLAGGTASRYPAGNHFAGLLADQLTNAAAGDFSLRADSFLRGAGTDGLDIGADVDAIAEGTAGVIEGRGAASKMAPSARFTASCTDLACSFTDTSTDADGTVAAWNWTFGDGATSSQQNALHTFNAAGTYSLTLTVTDSDGLTGTASQYVTVTAPNTPPSAALTASCTGMVCTFTDTSVDTDGTIVERHWSFGDGATGSAATETHTFAAPGTYAVSLDVKDDRGGTDRTTTSVRVGESIHIGSLTGAITTWKTYWSADMVLSLHDGNEQPVSGIAIAFEWTGAVAKLASCVTNAVGQCTIKSGTLSAKRPSVTLTVTAVSAPAYSPSANHGVPGPGAAITLELPKPIPPSAHIGRLTGATTTWSTYWSTAMVLTLHDENENPVAGATVAFEWTGAVVKLASCLTNDAGQCTVKSGTLSAKRPLVTLTVTDVAAPLRVYTPAGNHDVPGPGAAITMDLSGVTVPPPTSLTPAAHLGGLTAQTTAWSVYWSTEVLISVHDEMERPLPGATVSYEWSGALVKSASCVTTDAGECRVESGTLGQTTSRATLTITAVSAPSRPYQAAGNHYVPGPGAAITVNYTTAPPPLEAGAAASHVGALTGAITTWNTYWSTEMVVTIHDTEEAPVAGATVSAAWTGAVVKSASCITDSAGRCTMKSGTLSGKNLWVTLTVTGVAALSLAYDPTAAHAVPGGAAITLTKPVQ